MGTFDLDEYLIAFEPFRDGGEWVCEESSAYAKRMQMTRLPHWPEEVLIEWFYRHAGHLYDYAFLRFERFRFARQRWALSDIPGPEAFADPGFCENFNDVEARATLKFPNDVLAKFMLQHGTWPTPILLLHIGEEQIIAPGGWSLKTPWHLLEGHRRLSFLQGLRRLGKAAPEHDIWVVTVPEPI